MAELVVAGRIANPRRRVATRIALAPKSRYTIHHGAHLASTAHAGGSGPREPTEGRPDSGSGRSDRDTAQRPRTSFRTRVIARPVDPATVIATDPIINQHLDRYNHIRERRGMAPLTRADLVDLLGR